MSVKVEIDRRKLDVMIAGARQLDGKAILFGQPGPAPKHRGRNGKGSNVTTAFTLAVVEFGHPSSGRKKEPGPRAGKRRKKSLLRRLLGRFGRSLLGRLLKSFSGRRIAVKAKTKPTLVDTRERPVIRWVAQARRRVMRDGFRDAAKKALRRQDPKPELEALGERLTAELRERLKAVGGVDTGHTLETMSYRLTTRKGL